MKNAAIAANPESSLLLTLEEVSLLVSHSHDPQDTLTNTVRLIHGRFRTDVCSVYLIDPQGGDLVLAATVGLDPSSVGSVRMRFDEGLTGLVAERMAPVMEADAPAHPRFKYFQETGEDRFRSFLGVPIIEAGAVEGVLVVQTIERRPFSPNEARMLVTVASQLAPLVTGARLLEQVAAGSVGDATTTPAESETSLLRGRGLSPGRGVGLAYVVDDRAATGLPSERTAAEPAAEKARLAAAVEAAREEIARLSRRISLLVGEDHGAILQAQLMILQDRSVERDLDGRLEAGDSAEAAVAGTLEKYVATFGKMTNPFFQERIFDIKDVFRRIAWHLRPRDEAAILAGDDRLILVAREASVLDLFSVDLDRLAGVVVEHGGPQSHAGIIARSLGVPMVGQILGLLEQVGPGRRVAIDGGEGTLDLAPFEAPPRKAPDPALDGRAGGASAIPPPTLRIAASTAAPLQAEAAETPRVEANVNLLGEVGRVLTADAGAVGLYRSEMIFLARRTLPTEEEQVEIYRKLVEAVRGRSVTIRTFDLRPDKLAHGSAVASATSQALDWRLVLEAPALQRLFYEQVRAILRASASGPVRLLVPLVNRTALLDFALDSIQEARRELAREGLPHGRDVPVGAMIEVAAVAPLISDWAERVDFFSLGTNDLIASALGQDRDHPVGARADDALHPGLVRMIDHMIHAAHEAGRPISACGEMAADPAGALVLTALGVDSLSVAVDRIPHVRRALAGFPHQARPVIRGLILQARSTDDVVRAVQPFLIHAVA
ncbi:putative PEP-binding protein [Paludisphaera mucosa]|uniref:Phosphoenolpyruvate-utilizing N-terminal domain-containing protein n=1 Tax=Paludisphaera mucosa TaxID=3030827 RepID=A0ABT6FER6_9BACT|nr:putative PEP-binding protein [Paludisphaera mucosa]MDG3006061.1 phosphoenolpyruvate-utilizing N-terminal domain-containing protein [Paludisphaera mucosa]